MAVTGQTGVFTFQGNIAFSRGVREATDMATIKTMLDGCVSVEKTGEDKDRLHVDYDATLRGGAVVEIDAKARRKGCSKFWRGGVPDVALEIWSVMPAPSTPRGVVGWSLDESSRTGALLFTYHRSDTSECFLTSYQQTRIAFRRNHKRWMAEWNNGKAAIQTTVDEYTGRIRWRSSCIFVPAPVLLNAITKVSVGETQWTVET